MNKNIPMRICVGCQEMKEKRNMIRVLKTQENTFCLDVTGKKNGRGAYICKNADCLARAVKNHGLERSFKTSIPQDVAAELIKEMEELAK